MAKAFGGSWECNLHIKTVSELTLDQAKTLLSGWDAKHGGFDIWVVKLKYPLRVELTYPLSVPVLMHIGAGENGYLTFGEFLWQIAKQYEKIYGNPEAFGVWGHGIDDLFFERVTVKPVNIAEIFVGS